MLWDIFFLWKRTGVDCFFLADGRESQNHLKQITVGSQLHGAVLQFGQALCDGKAQTVAFALSGGIALNEALQQLVSRQVEGFAGDILKRDDGLSVFFFQRQIHPGGALSVFADIVHQIIKHTPQAATVRHDLNKKLVIDEEEAQVVRLMYDLCIGSGYGRFKIAMFLNENGIKTRDGKNWHEASVGRILHSILYTGVLRNGDVQSRIIPELQIITPESFRLAQELMDQRTNEAKEQRTMPRNTRGQSLLSGNVFCGHCGGRLTLTTNGTVRVNADGERIGRKRIRYVCYNKTRKRQECNGQTGYTMHILDKLVTDVLHEVFSRMQAVKEEEIVSRTHRSAVVSLKKRLTAAKNECAKATKEYESLKVEIIKAVQGESAFPMDVLSELVNNARTKMLEANEALTALNEEMAESESKCDRIRADYHRILQWAEMFDSSDMEVKKMIAGYIIKRVDVHSDYRLHIEFNMNFAQFELGLEIPNEYEMQDHAS